MLEKGALWHRMTPKEATRSVCVKTRIASNEAGIAQVINDLSNLPMCDPKAGALPGCTTPRLFGTLKNVSGLVLSQSLASTYVTKYASTF